MENTLWLLSEKHPQTGAVWRKYLCEYAMSKRKGNEKTNAALYYITQVRRLFREKDRTSLYACRHCYTVEVLTEGSVYSAKNANGCDKYDVRGWLGEKGEQESWQKNIFCSRRTKNIVEMLGEATTNVHLNLLDFQTDENVVRMLNTFFDSKMPIKFICIVPLTSQRYNCLFHRESDKIECELNRIHCFVANDKWVTEKFRAKKCRNEQQVNAVKDFVCGAH